jgi:hypothetical protein
MNIIIFKSKKGARGLRCFNIFPRNGDWKCGDWVEIWGIVLNLGSSTGGTCAPAKAVRLRTAVDPTL